MNREQILTAALIDLTQSTDVETSRRARSALFEVGVIHDVSDGGVQECNELWNNRIRSMTD